MSLPNVASKLLNTDVMGMDPAILILLFLDTVETVKMSRINKQLKNLIIGNEGGAMTLWQQRYLDTCQVVSCMDNSPSRKWKWRVQDIYPFLIWKTPFSVSVVPNYHGLTQRSGHSINMMDDGLILLYGGSTRWYQMLNTFDVIGLRGEDVVLLAGNTALSGSPPPPAWLHTANTVCTPGRVVIVYGGGGSDDSCVTEVHCLELLSGYSSSPVSSTRMTQCGDIPLGRMGHSTVTLEQCKLLVFGGRLRHPETRRWVCVNDMYLLDCATCTSERTVRWECLQPTGSWPSRRYCHSTLRKHARMFVFGGWDHSESADGESNKFLNDFFVYDIESNTWSEVRTAGVPPSPRCQMPCMHFTSLNRDGTIPGNMENETGSGYMVLFGGAYQVNEFGDDRDEHIPYGSRVVDAAEFFVLDLDTYTWLPVSMSFPRCRGGVNAVLYLEHINTWLMSGGMHSDHGAMVPEFRNDVVFIRPFDGL